MDPIDVLHLQPGSTIATRLTITPGLEALQRLVDGPVESLGLHRTGIVYINEDGKDRQLPRNISVELLFEAAGQVLLPGDIVAGPAVITGGYGPLGEDTGIDDRILDLCRRAGVTITAGQP